MKAVIILNDLHSNYKSNIIKRLAYCLHTHLTKMINLYICMYLNIMLDGQICGD